MNTVDLSAMTKEELEAINVIRKSLRGVKQEEAVENLIDLITRTRSNEELVSFIKYKNSLTI